MTTDTQGVLQADPPEAAGEGPAQVDFYDRSSLRGDFMVMIADQTEADYLRKAPKYPLCEFIDGVVYMHASPSEKHQLDAQLLLVLLEMFNSVHEVGMVLMAPAALRLPEGRHLQPDVFVLPTMPEGRDDILIPDPPALFVVEVLSPSTRAYDLNQKAALYREANTAEIWFVDGRDKVVLVERRTDHGYSSHRVASGPLHSTGLPGFWFDVAWLWAEPRPNLMVCLNQILAGPPVAPEA